MIKQDMKMPHVNSLPARLGAAVLISGIIVSAVSAQSAPTLPAARQGVSPITGRAAVPAPQTMIHGTVLNSTGSPLANAAVRLRNLKTRQVEQVTAASQSGEFTFTVLPQIPYVVEIADNAGQVIAVGDVLVAQVGEVAGVLVSAPVQVSAMAGVFGDTAASVLSAVAGTGLTAAGSALTPAPPASPER